MWVSGYPWGWMPSNYGNWVFVPGFGWVWQPGYFNMYSGIPRLVNAPVRTKVLTPPTSGHHTVMVGLGLTANPAAGASRRVTINPGLAGFGVPRGSVHHLDRVAKSMEHNPQPITVATAPPPVSTTTPTSGFGGSPLRSGSSMGTTSTGAHHSAAPASRPH